MNPNTTKKLIVSSIALSLVLGSSLYMTRNEANAAHKGSALVKQDNVRHMASDQSVHSGKHSQKSKGFPIVEEVAGIIGLEKEALKKSLKEGKTLVEIAKAKGISEADLTAKLLELRGSKIDQAVKDGKLDADKAAKMKERMSEHLKFMLNEKHILDKHDKHAKSYHHPSPEKLAKVIGISKEELKSQLKAGKSLTEIAVAQGISKEQLVEKIKEQMTPVIEKMVDSKRSDKAHK